MSELQGSGLGPGQFTSPGQPEGHLPRSAQGSPLQVSPGVLLPRSAPGVTSPGQPPGSSCPGQLLRAQQGHIQVTLWVQRPGKWGCAKPPLWSLPTVAQRCRVVVTRLPGHRATRATAAEQWEEQRGTGAQVGSSVQGSQAHPVLPPRLGPARSTPLQAAPQLQTPPSLTSHVSLRLLKTAGGNGSRRPARDPGVTSSLELLQA